jgi:hydrophobic/amphiphilic exporter-1 (mainly G- bacteria), HAE1 family
MQKLAELCIRRPVFATMLVMTLTVIGAFAYLTLGVDRFPNVEIPFVTIITTNPGASPEEMEREVTNRIEGAVNTVSGIELLNSSSVEGLSQVVLQFQLEKNGDVAAQEVRQAVDLVLNDLPRTVKPPIVQKLAANAVPVVQYAVSSSNLPLVELTDLVQRQIVERLEPVAGVGRVSIYGGRKREIQISVTPDRLRAYGLTVAEVATSLRDQNLELPGGNVNEGARSLNLRTRGKLMRADEFADLVVANRNGFAVRVRDIGEVEDRGETPKSVALRNGQTAVVVEVSKQSGRNTVAVTEAVKERMAEIQAMLPRNLTVNLVRDQSDFIYASLHSINEHIIVGGLLAAIVVYLFLRNFRSTLIAAVAIPISVIAAFGAMAALGYTLNTITMLSLTLMVGIVIDDAIVVLENIYRCMDEEGMDAWTASIEGTKQIGLAVMATTLSLLAVFVPIGFMSGIVGRFMSSFGLTAAAAIAVSLIVSFTLTPMLAARFVDPKRRRHEEGHEGWYARLDAFYTKLLRWSMAHRWWVVAACVGIVLSTGPIAGLVGASFLPEDDEGEFNVTVRLPAGASLAATESTMERMAMDLRQSLPEIASTLVIAGYNSQELPNAGSIFVRLTPATERARNQVVMMNAARQLLAKYPNEIVTSVMAVDAFGGSDRVAAVMVAITGPDLKKLDDYSARLLAKMRADKVLVDTDRSLQPSRPELQLRILRDRAADLNVPVVNIASTLNTLYAGETVSTFSRGKDQYKVVLRANRDTRQDREAVLSLAVPSSTGAMVEMRNLVRMESGSGPESIDHLNRERQVMMYANVDPTASESEGLVRIEEYLAELNLEPGYHTLPQGNTKELEKSNYYFMLAFSLSFIFMYIVLAAQFESFIHPITILLTLPISVPFGLLSLVVMNDKLNLFSALGILLLFGVVKKNAILQIDHTIELRAKGMPRYDAIILANRQRLRPILMTTIALVAGMLPMLVGKGAGAATNRSIAVLVVGGQSLCLLITLLATPVIYSLFEDLAQANWWRRPFGLAKKADATA